MKALSRLGWIAAGPFLMLAAAGILLLARWSHVPDPWPVRFDRDGRPDGWTEKRYELALLPLLIGAVGCAIVLWAARWSADRDEASVVERWTLVATAFFMALVASLASFLPLGIPARVLVTVVPGGVLVLMGGSFGCSLRLRPNQEGWRGVLYDNAADPRLFVPKRIGYGWTVNIGRPAGKALTLILVGVPVAIVATLFVRSLLR